MGLTLHKLKFEFTLASLPPNQEILIKMLTEEGRILAEASTELPAIENTIKMNSQSKVTNYRNYPSESKIRLAPHLGLILSDKNFKL